MSLVDDPEPVVRDRLAFALGRGFAPDHCVPALLRLLDDREAAVRAAAAKTLGAIRPEVAAVLPRLVEMLEDADCGGEAAWAIWQLGQKKPKEVVPSLRQALKDPKAATRSEALRIVQLMRKAAERNALSRRGLRVVTLAALIVSSAAVPSGPIPSVPR